MHLELFGPKYSEAVEYFSTKIAEDSLGRAIPKLSSLTSCQYCTSPLTTQVPKCCKRTNLSSMYLH